MSARTNTGGAPAAARAVGWLGLAGALGAAVMTLAHLGLDLPIVSDLGSGRLLLPVAVGFGVGAVLFAAVGRHATARAMYDPGGIRIQHSSSLPSARERAAEVGVTSSHRRSSG